MKCHSWHLTLRLWRPGLPVEALPHATPWCLFNLCCPSKLRRPVMDISLGSLRSRYRVIMSATRMFHFRDFQGLWGERDRRPWESRRVGWGARWAGWAWTAIEGGVAGLTCPSLILRACWMCAWPRTGVQTGRSGLCVRKSSKVSWGVREIIDVSGPCSPVLVDWGRFLELRIPFLCIFPDLLSQPNTSSQQTNTPTNKQPYKSPGGHFIPHEGPALFLVVRFLLPVDRFLFKHYFQERNPPRVCVSQIANGHLWVFQLFGAGWTHLPISKGKGLESSGTAYGFLLTMSWSANEWKIGRLNVPYCP